MTKRRLESLRTEMQKCTRCSLCKMVPMPTVQNANYANACPPVMANHFHAYSGGGLQVMALSLTDGRIEVDEDLARVAFACHDVWAVRRLMQVHHGGRTSGRHPRAA